MGWWKTTNLENLCFFLKQSLASREIRIKTDLNPPIFAGQM